MRQIKMTSSYIQICRKLCYNHSDSCLEIPRLRAVWWTLSYRHTSWFH